MLKIILTILLSISFFNLGFVAHNLILFAILKAKKVDKELKLVKKIKNPTR